MPIVLRTSTSSSTKFVDLSYYVQSRRDSMKVLQPLVAKNARWSSSICCRWQTKQWMQQAIVFSFSLFCFAKLRICAYFTVKVQIMRIHTLCFILREFCSKVKPQKERWNFPFILARARSRLCRKFKLAARWVKLSAEARTLVADCNVLLLHSKDVSSYIDPQKQFNQNGG